MKHTSSKQSAISGSHPNRRLSSQAGPIAREAQPQAQQRLQAAPENAGRPVMGACHRVSAVFRVPYWRRRNIFTQEHYQKGLRKPTPVFARFVMRKVY